MPFRNLESHFAKLPQNHYARTKMAYNGTHKTTFNAGDLVPILVEEVLPGDTFNIKTAKCVRMATSLHPTMDNLYIDTYYFYVPNRLIWDDWQHFMGENDKPWAIDTSQFVPPFDVQDQQISKPGSVLNYLGLPTYEGFASRREVKHTILDFNAYCKVWNDWFRDENLVDEVPIYKGSGRIPTSFVDSYGEFVRTLKGGSDSIRYYDHNSCLPVAKFHDYFTSALPQPQKGADVLIPAFGTVSYQPGEFEYGLLRTYTGEPIGSGNQALSSNAGSSTTSSGTLVNANGQTLSYDPNGTLGFDGLEITINSLRLAIQTQKLLERDARGGTRYNEILQSHFGVTSPDARLQRSEYLGGKRTSINMSEVIQTSQTTEDSALGALGGRSLTADTEAGFTKSFVEHGYIIGVACVRPDRTYAQGLHKRYSRFSRLDYYFPVLANIGEQPILNKELYLAAATDDAAQNDEVFGYQEAWAEYRYQVSRLSGYMAPGITKTLDSWTYADSYDSLPHLGGRWLYQGKNEVDRTIAIQSELTDQFIADFYFHGSCVRTMPLYSIPGLVDHN